jgi:hypothetical protein
MRPVPGEQKKSSRKLLQCAVAGVILEGLAYRELARPAFVDRGRRPLRFSLYALQRHSLGAVRTLEMAVFQEKTLGALSA